MLKKLKIEECLNKFLTLFQNVLESPNKQVLSNNSDILKYGEYDTKKDVIKRVNNCMKAAQRDKKRKADRALGKPTFANLDINNNLNKLKKTFPPGPPKVMLNGDVVTTVPIIV